jgi:oligopeptide/dipeptide ABC transporter ATP-binding protein
MLLSVDSLSVQFGKGNSAIHAVNNVSFHINKGETVGLVGESGCGKSVTSLSLLRLIEKPAGKITNGQILLDGYDLTSATTRDMKKIRGSKIGMIFQEPMTSFNPVFTIGEQLTEAILIHKSITYNDAWNTCVEMLENVGIPSPEERMTQYPHELSGGMKQRAMIAMALVCQPQLLIADEPTTALDVTVQAQILELLADIQRKYDMSILLITHDLSVVAETCDRVYVMYASEIVEESSTSKLFKNPLHPYTRGLFNSLPTLHNSGEKLNTIPGQVPNPQDFPTGCHFHPRCPNAQDVCRNEKPILEEKSLGQKCACHMVEGKR